jgi:hypothetical protein
MKRFQARESHVASNILYAYLTGFENYELDIQNGGHCLPQFDYFSHLICCGNFCVPEAPPRLSSVLILRMLREGHFMADYSVADIVTVRPEPLND